MNARFLLAKYVPDLNRMEPRNVGIFLWAHGRIASRFLSPKEANFVHDLDNYQAWIESWESIIKRSEIPSLRGGSIDRRSNSCLEALLSHQEGNYLLVDAGELLAPIEKEELNDALDFLYKDLVAPAGAARVSRKAASSMSSIRREAKRLFESTGIASRGDWHDGYRVELPVFGVRRHLRFTFGIGNGHPSAIYQTAKLGSEQSVNSAALMIHSIIESTVLPEHHCAALVQESDIKSDAADEGFHQLKRLCTVIDLDSKDAKDQLMAIASSSPYSPSDLGSNAHLPR